MSLHPQLPSRVGKFFVRFQLHRASPSRRAQDFDEMSTNLRKDDIRTARCGGGSRRTGQRQKAKVAPTWCIKAGLNRTGRCHRPAVSPSIDRRRKRSMAAFVEPRNEAFTSWRFIRPIHHLDERVLQDVFSQLALAHTALEISKARRCGPRRGRRAAPATPPKRSPTESSRPAYQPRRLREVDRWTTPFRQFVRDRRCIAQNDGAVRNDSTGERWVRPVRASRP